MTPHYGLKGTGARIAGLLIFAYGLLLTLYGSKEWKVPSVTVLDVTVPGVTLLVQCFVAWIITVIMIAICGNGYEEKPLPDSFSRKGALFSILATVSWVIVTTIITLIDVVARPFGGPHPMLYLVFGYGSLIIIPLGFILAIVALFGIRKRGARGILGWAILGLIINGQLIASSIMRVEYGRDFSAWVKIGTTTASTRHHAPGTPTDAECEELGRQLETNFAERDYDFYVNAIDFDSLLERSFSGLNGQKPDLKKVKEVKKGFYRTINDQMLRVKSVKFLRLKQLDGEQGILLRLILNEGGLDYLVSIPKYNRDGDLKIVDAFNYAEGIKLSELLKYSLIQILQKNDRTLARQLFTNSDLVTYEPQWERMVTLNTQGKYTEALAIYDQLPASVQHEKVLLSEKILAAQTVDEHECLAAIELWRTLYPNDPFLDLASLNFYLGRRQHNKILECIDKLDKTIGGDPYLDWLRSFIFMKMDDFARTKKFATQAFNREPTLTEAGYCVIGLLSFERKYDECVGVLEKMQFQGGCSKIALRCKITESKNNALIESQVYQNWINSTATAPTQPVMPSKEETGSAAIPEFKLQAILYTPTRSSATINNKFVMVGDKVDGCKVITIEQRSVTIESSSGNKTELKLSEPAK
jgi:tetratricopeptide (TPR) repeat protein